MSRPLSPEQSRFAARGLVVVKMLARVFARSWRTIPESDFLSVGHEEVVRAAALFDPTVGRTFEQYARPAINGAMIDLTRRERRERHLQNALDYIHRNQLDASRQDLALSDIIAEPNEPGESPHAEVAQELRGRYAEVLTATLSAGTQALTGDEDAVIEDIERRAILERLRGAVAGLSEEERTFVRSYYEDGETVDVIAKRLGVVRRTVFRMQERVVGKLVGALKREG